MFYLNKPFFFSLVLMMVAFNALSEEKDEHQSNDERRFFAGFFVGYNTYQPKLGEIHSILDKNGLQDLHGNSQTFFSIHFGDERKGTYKGFVIAHSGYKGVSDFFSISVTNISVNYLQYLSEKDDRLKAYLSAGANAFGVERHGVPETRFIFGDIQYNDTVYGLNCLLGFALKIVGPFHVGYELGYVYGNFSTLGGTKYDLSDFFQSFYVGALLM